MASERHVGIDYLRGFAMLAMILIHTNAYHLSDPTAYVLWNYSQFAVQIFVFCSMYLFVKKNDFSTFTWPDLIAYYKKYIPKRFFRLVLPYYIFLPFYLVLQASINHKLPSISYIFQSLTLTGGVDINWLVLLFLQLTFISPLLLYLFQRYRYARTFCSFILVVFLIFCVPISIRKSFINYRWFMWIGWSYFFVLAYAFMYPSQLEARKKRIAQIFLGILGILFFFTPMFQNLYDQKYPPNVYFIAYGAIWIIGLYLFFLKVSLPRSIQNFIHFFSKYSYSLFFIHYWILVFVSFYFTFNWYTFFIVVLCASAGVQWGYNQLTLRVQKKKE
jgi:peptidoglycan/LPS O-acetylase OafA/YrhL